MAMMDITVVPLGTGSPSVSEYVAAAERVIRASGLKSVLTPTSTVLEGPLEELLALVPKLHEALVEKGAQRVVTTIRLDDRRDKELTFEGKLQAVERKLEGETE